MHNWLTICRQIHKYQIFVSKFADKFNYFLSFFVKTSITKKFLIFSRFFQFCFQFQHSAFWQPPRNFLTMYSNNLFCRFWKFLSVFGKIKSSPKYIFNILTLLFFLFSQFLFFLYLFLFSISVRKIWVFIVVLIAFLRRIFFFHVVNLLIFNSSLSSFSDAAGAAV